MVHLLMTRDQQRDSEMREMANILNGMSSGLLPCYITLEARAQLRQFSRVIILNDTQKIAWNLSLVMSLLFSWADSWNEIATHLL